MKIMKKALMMAAFLAFAATAHGQAGQFGSLNNVAPITSNTSIGATGGLNSDTGIGNPSGIPASNTASTGNVSDTNPGEYIPSRFEGYKEAVSDGKAWSNRKSMTIAEMARQSQADKKAAEGKKVMVLEQGSDGKLVILEPTASAATAAAAVTAPAANSDAASVPVATTTPATEEKK
jgi:hypothetical protein